MHIAYYAPQLTPGCCPHHVYAVLLTPSHQALLQIAPNLWELSAYENDPNFAIWLHEHEDRTFYYYLDLDESQFTLPQSSSSAPYVLEFWRSDNGQANREIDTFLGYELFHWSGSEREDVRLGASDLSLIKPTEVRGSAVFDASESTLRYTAWAQRDGAVLIADSMELEIFDDSGAIVASIAVTHTVPSLPGVFHGIIEAIDFNPDRFYFFKASVQISNSQTETQIFAIPAWD